MDALIRAICYRARTRSKGRNKVRAAIEYFRKRRHRMQYARYQEQNLPIGTGVTEAACKTLASERMKQSGMRWGMEGGQAILTLRSLIQSDRWERGWELMASTYLTFEIWLTVAVLYFLLTYSCSLLARMLEKRMRYEF